MKFNFQKQLTHVGGLAAGGVVVKLTDKMLSNLNPTIRAAAQIGLGIVGPSLMKAKPNSIIESIGDGMAAVGVYKMLENIPGLAGVADLDSSIGETGYVTDDLSGFDEEISGVDDLSDSIGNLDIIDEL
jgi:hypothetical protein